MKSLFQGEFEFSYTDFKDYKKCPRRFALKFKSRIEKFWFRAGNSRKYLEGWCVHKCAELWNKKGHWAPGWMLGAVVREDASPPGSPKIFSVGLDPEKSNLLPLLLKEYLRKNNVFWRPGETEESVLKDIRWGLGQLEYWILTLEMNHDKMDSEKKFRLRLPQLRIVLRGSVDMLDSRLPDIYDLKYSKDNYVDWDQLLWYDFAMTTLLDKKIRRVYTFNPLNDQPLEDREYSKEDLAELCEDLTETIMDIRAGKLDPVPERGECCRCPVARGCDACAFKP